MLSEVLEINIITISMEKQKSQYNGKCKSRNSEKVGSPIAVSEDVVIKPQIAQSTTFHSKIYQYNFMQLQVHVCTHVRDQCKCDSLCYYSYSKNDYQTN